MLRRALLILSLLIPLPSVAQDQSIEVLHWWTAGGEAKAADMLRHRWQQLGNNWVDSAIVGGGGNSAMLVLRSRTLAGNPPQVAHLKGSELHEWARLGFLRPLDDVARRGQWDLRLYPFVSSTINHQGHTIAVPVGIHRVNWLWINQPLFQRLQLPVPRTWPELLSTAATFKAAGINPLALGDDPWQLAILFEAIVLGEGDSDLFRRAFINLDARVFTSPRMLDILRLFHRLRAFLPSNHIGLSWNQATQMLMDGQAAMQLMGDWVKGELIANGLEPGQTIRCVPAPGTAGKFSYNLDSLAMFEQHDPARDRDQQSFADMLMSSDFQRDFNRVKGSIPPRTDADISTFDRCARDAWQALQQAERHGELVPSAAEGMALTPQVQQALFEVLASYFADPQGDAEETAHRLQRALRAVQAEWRPEAN